MDRDQIEQLDSSGSVRIWRDNVTGNQKARPLYTHPPKPAAEAGEREAMERDVEDMRFLRDHFLNGEGFPHPFIAVHRAGQRPGCAVCGNWEPAPHHQLEHELVELLRGWRDHNRAIRDREPHPTSLAGRTESLLDAILGTEGGEG